MTVKEILEAYGKIGVERVKQALESVRATGKTIQSVRYEASENRLVIKARPFTSAIETGVKPTDKGIHPDMIKNLTEYAQARGMDNPKSAAWAMAKTIQAKGDKTFRQGGREVYSDDLVKLAEEIKRAVSREYKIRFTSFIKNTF